MKKIRLAGLLALSMTAGLSGNSTASADVIINSPFYEEAKSGTCSSASCLIEFTSPTSRVLFSKLNCTFGSLSAQVVQIELAVRDAPGSLLRRIEFIPFSPPVVTANGQRFYSLSVPLDFLFAAGKIPTLFAVTEGTTGGTVNCKITGRIQA